MEIVLSQFVKSLAESGLMNEGEIEAFINTLPLRMSVPPEEKVVDWLGRLQARQFELIEHSHSPLVSVQGWSEATRGRPLFDTIFMFENYRKDATLKEMSRRLRIGDVRWIERMAAAVTTA